MIPSSSVLPVRGDLTGFFYVLIQMISFAFLGNIDDPNKAWLCKNGTALFVQDHRERFDIEAPLARPASLIKQSILDWLRLIEPKIARHWERVGAQTRSLGSPIMGRVVDVGDGMLRVLQQRRSDAITAELLDNIFLPLSSSSD